MLFRKECFLCNNNEKTADFSRSASGCALWRALRLVALLESGGRYNIDPDCGFSNGFITILFELIRDATRLRCGCR